MELPDVVKEKLLELDEENNRLKVVGSSFETFHKFYIHLV